MSPTGEFRRLADLSPFLTTHGPGVPVGVGDDAAVITLDGVSVVVCADAIVQDVHFTSAVSTPGDIGWKAIVVNVSDVAAMGAVPLAALVVLQRPPTLSEADIRGLYEGMDEACSRYGLHLVGGDTVTAPVLSLAVTALGRPAERPVTRAGAQPGDRVLLVGPLGLAAAALARLEAGQQPPAELLDAHRRPHALPSSGQALARAGATSLIDVSDGLGADARHLAEASRVALRIFEADVRRAIPPGVSETAPADGGLLLALSGGEDFGLLATVPPDRVPMVEEALKDAGESPCWWIGQVEQGHGLVWLDRTDGTSERIDAWGYDHG